MLPDCLRSVAGIVDEIVVVDTGSTDRTREVFAEIAPKVSPHGALVDFPWTDDFAEARNIGLRHVHGEWVLYLDADERLVVPPGPEAARRELLKLLAACPDGRHPVAAAMFWFQDLDSTGRVAPGEAHMTRLVKNHPSLRFERRIHEQPKIACGTVAALDPQHLYIQHMGYTPQVWSARGKTSRNEHLCRMMLADDPTDAETAYYLGRDLLRDGRAEEALPFLRLSWTRQPRHKNGRWFQCYATARFLARCLQETGRTDEALNLCRQVIADHPAFADRWVWQGITLLAAARPAEALAAFEEARRICDERGADAFIFGAGRNASMRLRGVELGGCVHQTRPPGRGGGVRRSGACRPACPGGPVGAGAASGELRIAGGGEGPPEGSSATGGDGGPPHFGLHVDAGLTGGGWDRGPRTHWSLPLLVGVR